MCLSGTATKETGLENLGAAPPPSLTEKSSSPEECIPIVVWRRRRKAPNGRAPQLELPDLGSPFASKPDVVAYDRHVLFTSDDPADATRHSSPSLISTTRIDETFVHKMPEQFVGLVFAQADLVCRLLLDKKKIY